MDIVVLLCDTARADAFSPWGAAHRSPTMERLCEEGLMYANAGSQAPWTVPSIASMFSGRLPTEHGITGECLSWRDRRPTSPAEAVAAYSGTWLPETLRERGYRTWGASCNSWISRWGGFDRGFDEFLDLRPWARDRSALGRVRHRARRVLGTVDRGGREGAIRFARLLADPGPEPLFVFVNLMETHAPLDPPRPYYPWPGWRRFRTRRLAGGPDQGLSYNAGVVAPGPGYAEALRPLYSACARYEDHVLGQFLEAVEGRGRPTLVVVVADHGEHLGEHGLFNHNSSLHQPLLHVPLVAWARKLTLGTGRIEEPVSLLGLASWLRDLTDGESRVMRGIGPVVSEYEGTARHNGIPRHIEEGIGEGLAVPPLVFHPGLAVRSGSLKYVAVGNGDEALYDLDADPGEDHNLLGGRPDAAAEFRPFRDAWEERRSGRPTYESGDLAEGQIAEHLRELGYIE
jgi:arylsulfatase A-like enzyme